MGVCVVVFVYVAVVLTGSLSDGAECCAYTDLQGKDHGPFLCHPYCCFDVVSTYAKVNVPKSDGVTGAVGINVKQNYPQVCCNDTRRQVPSEERSEECFRSWLHQNIWAPIVGGIIVLGFVVVVCVCCCYGRCDCSYCHRGFKVSLRCSCLHNEEVGKGGQRQTVIMMSSPQDKNPVHAGYNQGEDHAIYS